MMMEGIMMGVGGTLLSVALIALFTLIIRLYRTPKRLDRLERLIPTMARALLVLLQRHVNDESNGEAEEALTELKLILTDGAVSQKEGK